MDPDDKKEDDVYYRCPICTLVVPAVTSWADAGQCYCRVFTCTRHARGIPH